MSYRQATTNARIAIVNAASDLASGQVGRSPRSAANAADLVVAGAGRAVGRRADSPEPRQAHGRATLEIVVRTVADDASVGIVMSGCCPPRQVAAVPPILVPSFRGTLGGAAVADLAHLDARPPATVRGGR